MPVAPHQPASNTIIPKGTSGQISARGGDGRVGLGYGTLDPLFNRPWMYSGTFPFTPPDDAADTIPSEKDEESMDAVSSKIAKFQKTDPLAFKGSTPLYFVGATTRLKSCFTRPDEVLTEIETLDRSMTPIPNLYGKGARGGAVGGFSTAPSFHPGSYRRTGTEKGWSSSPPATHAEYVLEDEEEEMSSHDEFYNLFDLAMLQRPSLDECFFFEDNT